MKHSLPPLDGLKVFEAAARHLSFRLAAAELCLSKGAVSYQIRKLEEHIQCPLFMRYTRQVYLTEAGQTLFKCTQEQFARIYETLSILKTNQHKQPVTIAATTYVAVRWLSSRIAQFNQHYPEIMVQFQHAVNSSQFNLKDVDIAIRWCRCNDNSKVKRLLELPMPLYPVCCPKLLERTGLSTHRKINQEAMTTTELSKIPLLCEAPSLDLWDAWFSVCGLNLNNPRRIISDANVRVQAAIDGQGFILADELMRNEMDNGLLIAPFKEELLGFGYALMCSPARVVNHNVTALREWLIKS